MTQTVIGFFENKEAALRAADQLVSNGYRPDQIDMASPVVESNKLEVEKKAEHESGLKRFFKTLFGDTDEAERYSNVSHGHTIVTVTAHSQAEAEQAADVMDDCGAIDIDEYSAQQNPATYRDDTRETDYRNNAVEAPLPRREENEINDKPDERFDRRQRSRIINSPVDESNQRQQAAGAEKTSADNAAPEQELGLFQEGEIELTERKEIPVIKKEARVVEEIKVSKEMEERTETLHDTVRSTEVDINRTDANERSNSGLNEPDMYRSQPKNEAGENRSWNQKDIKRTEENRDEKRNVRNNDPLFGA